MARPRPDNLISNVALTADDADSRSVAPRKILIAGDNAVAQRLLKVVLAKRGHTVEIADSGEQALSRLENGRFDFVLIDLQAFRSEGIRIVNAFRGRRSDDDSRARFIGLATDSDAALHADERTVFDVVITKPVDVVLLCEIIERFETYTAWMPAPTDITPVLLTETPSASDERRSFQRVRVAHGGAKLTLSDGTKQACRVVDLSLGGAALETYPRPAIGTQVTVGRTNGRVIRHTANGVAVEFTKSNSMASTKLSSDIRNRPLGDMRN
jgi:CheY-like chemotaxis protein